MLTGLNIILTYFLPLSQVDVVRQLCLRFSKPTCFKDAGRKHLVPEAEEEGNHPKYMTGDVACASKLC